MKVKTGLLLLVFAGLNFLGASPGYSQDILMLKAGASHTAALRSDGTLWTWGRNSNGQLGDGSWTNKNVPTRVPMLTDIIGVAVGDYHTLAIKADGTLWAWGWNEYGQLGDGTAVQKPIPVQIMDPLTPAKPFGWNHGGVVEAAASYRHTLARMADGTVWAWGYNYSGQLGDDTYAGKLTPVQVKTASGFLTDVIALSASDTYGGYGHSMALKADKTVWTWGTGDFSAIGRPTTGAGATRQQVAASVGLSNIGSIGTGLTFCLARAENGSVYGWGRNLEGQLGDGTQTTRATPTLVPGLSNVVAIAANDSHAMAVKQDRTVWAWGSNYGGPLCDGTVTNRLSPVQMHDPLDSSGFLTGVNRPVSGWDHNLVLKQDGSIWGCGWNYYGQIGTGAFSGGSQALTTPVQTKFPPASLVYVYGLNYISPGEEGTFLVEYENVFGFALENAVVVFNLPEAFTYVSSTSGAIYRSDANQVFWRLGNLTPGSKGQLYVKANVPWGLPLHSKVSLMVNMGAVNYPGNLDVNEYLTYGTVQLVQNKTLTTQEIATLRSQDPALEGLLTQALALGFGFYDVAQQVTYNDGTTYIRLVLFDFSDFAPAFLYSMGGRAHIEKVRQDKYTLFDLNGGMTINRNSGSAIPWGNWANSYSLRSNGSIISGGNWVESYNLTFAQCLMNCTIEKVPAFVVGKYLTLIGTAMDGLDCVTCLKTREDAACKKCATSLGPEKLAFLKEMVDGLTCVDECKKDANSHICTNVDPIKSCDPDAFLTKTMSHLDMGVRYETRCNTTLGIYGWPSSGILCAIGEVCNNGLCVDKAALAAACPPSNPDVDPDSLASQIQLRDLRTPGSTVSSCASKETEIRTSHDPNIKQADVKGDVLSGQRITYTVECQNLGAGTAYGVFILDELDPNLNEATLNINNGGSYVASGRLLSWNIGTLAPSETRTVSFSVNVKSGLAEGTQITNKAEVYFPSANEITPTNPVVHVVYPLAADPQILTTTSGTATSVMLTGRGAGSLSYQITAAPRYGTLTGTPPSLSYRSMDEFVGQDSLGFVVISGGSNSRPATVTFNVGPNPLDTKPPTVVSTSPASGATNVPFVTVPVAQNPICYLPAITATFSEALDPSTVNTSTFKVAGLTGAVSYDELTKTVVFLPLSPLDSTKSYTAQLTAGIRDKIGNAMSPV